MNRNAFVDFINQFYSQSVSQSAGYSEISTQKLEGISLKVNQLVDDVAKGDVNVVILTGNAGDGKTFVCEDIYKRLTGQAFPNQVIFQGKIPAGEMLNVVKDASEVSEERLENFLKEMETNLPGGGGRRKAIFILAGNEGKLSEVFEKFELPHLRKLLDEALRPCFDDGSDKGKRKVNEFPHVKVLNFNWRDLTSVQVFRSIILSFVQDKSKWESRCNYCQYSKSCAIYLNVHFLREEDVIERIRTLFRFFRYQHGHFSLRELLSAVAYIITAGFNCDQIHKETQDKRQLDFMFYNNIFSQQPFMEGESHLPLDRILRGLQPFDVSVAPLPRVNKEIYSTIKGLKNIPPNHGEEVELDLSFFKEIDELNKLPFLDAFKRRIYFCGKKEFWGDFLFFKLGDILRINHIEYLPFTGYGNFDAFLSGESDRGTEGYKNIESTIVKGLNLLANRNDDAPDFWLKVYKPSGNVKSMILELFGDVVETLDIKLFRKKPSYDPKYIEFANTELYFSVKVDKDDAGFIHLPVSLELYEGLYSAARRNQSKQGFGYLERVIREFRETLYYRVLKRIGSRKFLLNAPGTEKPMEVFLERERILIRR